MYRSILVPYDGSAPSARTLPLAAAIARHTGASVRVAIVHDPSAYIPFVPGEVAIPVYDQELVATHRRHDQELLDAAVAQFAAAGVNVTVRCSRAPSWKRSRACAADRRRPHDHGHPWPSGFERLRLGSIATAYLTRATMPVLLVPGAESYTPGELPPVPCSARWTALRSPRRSCRMRAPSQRPSARGCT